MAMINEKKAGLPVSKQRELPRIVAGTDLMAALRQSIEKSKEAAPKATVTKPAPATAAAGAPKGKKVAKRNPDQREILADSWRRTHKGGGRETAVEVWYEPAGEGTCAKCHQTGTGGGSSRWALARQPSPNRQATAAAAQGL